MAEKSYDPDRPHLSASSPDDPGFMNVATLSAVAENEQLKRELAKERALKEQLKHEHADGRSDLEISEDFLESEVQRTQEFIFSEEGEAFLKRDIAEYYAKGGERDDPERDILHTYARKQRGKMKAEMDMLYPQS
jgi:hypothetical protein